MHCFEEIQLKLSAKLMVGLWLSEQTAAHLTWTTVLPWWSKPLPASLSALCCVHFMSHYMLQDPSRGALAPHQPAQTMKRQAVGIGRGHPRAQHHEEVLAQGAPTGLPLIFCCLACSSWLKAKPPGQGEVSSCSVLGHSGPGKHSVVVLAGKAAAIGRMQVVITQEPASSNQAHGRVRLGCFRRCAIALQRSWRCRQSPLPMAGVGACGAAALAA